MLHAFEELLFLLRLYLVTSLRNFAFHEPARSPILTDITPEHLDAVMQVLELGVDLVDVVEQRIVLLLAPGELLDQLLHVVVACELLGKDWSMIDSVAGT